jgi:uncharacterized membrane protein
MLVLMLVLVLVIVLVIVIVIVLVIVIERQSPRTRRGGNLAPSRRVRRGKSGDG